MNNPDFDHILKQYNNPRLIKQAGQKIVYEAVDNQNRRVALKVGRYDLSGQKLERLQREVDTLKALSSDYYPANYAFEAYPDGTFYILEEFIEGEPLSLKITEYTEVVKALNLIKEMVKGLGILWSKNVVHRDLKPDNVMIRPNGNPVIIDLGIARLLDLDTLTATGMAGPGTRQFAAPEQFRAERRGEINSRTDQFSLGIMLFILVTGGKHPFDGALVGSGDIATNIVRGTWAKNLIDAPGFECLRDLIVRLLSTYPYERFKDSTVLLEAIERCIQEYS